VFFEFKLPFDHAGRTPACSKKSSISGSEDHLADEHLGHSAGKAEVDALANS
jgi:hypothetical protein